MTRTICYLMLLSVVASPVGAAEVDRILTGENSAKKVATQPLPVVDDLTFLRRVSVDLIGRIPTGEEIREFSKWPAQERRAKLIDKLCQDPRFIDRWTAFFGDMLRLRSNATGGAALTAYVHQALADEMPYDELCRRLLTANGKANKIPEAGFVLADNADPMAMASISAQVFLGVRISCAQCHDHPFDVWTRKDFYGLAAYFGRTRRVENQKANLIYSTEVDQNVILWPPEGVKTDQPRKPMPATFPFELVSADADHVVRMTKLRESQKTKKVVDNVPSIDDLLAATANKATQRAGLGEQPSPEASEAKTAIRDINIQASLYRHSELRSQLAEQITSPRNQFFSRALVNRLWKELIGRGFVEPVDDFRDDNTPSHPKTIDYLANEFVASGFNFKHLVKLVVNSDAYQRSHVPQTADDLVRTDLESHFLATPLRRMVSEAMFDSIIAAGHLFEVKHMPGQNPRTITELVRVPKEPTGEEKLTSILPKSKQKMAMEKPMMVASAGYRLEDAIELDFTSLLKGKDDEISIEKMQVMSQEELEAQRMAMERNQGPAMKYDEKFVQRVVDDNPVFNSSLRIASPAPNGHFLRVFGQTDRETLGEARDDAPTMRQALLMLNGRLTHEASRVGVLEPMHKLLSGEKPQIEKAIRLAYEEVLTRLPTAKEVADAKAIIADAATPLDGMADFRWVLLNCNEFRFLP